MYIVTINTQLFGVGDQKRLMNEFSELMFPLHEIFVYCKFLKITSSYMLQQVCHKQKFKEPVAESSGSTLLLERWCLFWLSSLRYNFNTRNIL